MVDDEEKSLLNKLGKIDKLEARQFQHDKEIKEIKEVLNSNELNGRLVKVEKRQEFVLEQLKEMHKDIGVIEDKCDKQRSGCMAAVAPISLVSDLKNDLKLMEERIHQAYIVTRAEAKTAVLEARGEARTAVESASKWTRWAFILSMLACITSSVSVLVCVNVLLHLPK